MKEMRSQNTCWSILIIILAVMASAVPYAALAQRVTAPGEEMFLDRTSGEETVPTGNYWDGVDSDNDLHVPVMNARVLDDIGGMAGTPMPSYPNFVDMNDDGLKDLVVADTQGFIWIYPNSGTKGAPKFTTGTFLPTFAGWVSKIHVCDWDNDGDNDIVIGTFFGDIVVFQNYGNQQQWQFTRRMGVPRYVSPAIVLDDVQEALPQLKMGKKPMIKGNYLAPWVCDWNKDGKPDLLIGEGTYSANSVRLLINSGARNRPAFSEEKEFYLAFGEGYEQLVPAVVDYNGDGIDDLIVGTRTGQIRLHKGTKKAVEGKDFVAAMRGNLAPAILEFDGNLKIAGKEIFDKMSNVYPCDWNEDGLFDLLLGSTKGKIYIAVNKGTKTEPDFPSAVPVKGTDVEKDFLAPANWNNGIDYETRWNNFVLGFCNSALILSCEKEVPFKRVPIRPVAGSYFMYYRYVHNYPGWMPNSLNYLGALYPNSSVKYITGGRYIRPEQTFNLKKGRKYEFSFSSVLEGKPAMWKFWVREVVFPGDDIKPCEWEHRQVTQPIPPSNTWVKRRYTFKCPNTVQTNCDYHFYFRMPEGECKFMVDNLSLKELEK